MSLITQETPSFWRSLTGVVASLIGQRYLIRQLTGREIAARYRGSAFGVLWSLLQPLLMLAIYSFVFTVIFRARWPELAEDQGPESQGGFAVVLFAGLITHGFLGDCLARAPRLITDNANFVKRLIFPLEVLPWTVVASALVHMIVSLMVLLAFALIAFGTIPWTAIFLPLILVPYAILVVGLVWLISAVGVFIEDIGQVIGICVTALLFLAPVFYPLSAVPEALQGVIYLNPITLIVSELRAILIWGELPNIVGLLTYAVVAFAIAWLGYYVFQRLRRAFADVL